MDAPTGAEQNSKDRKARTWLEFLAKVVGTAVGYVICQVAGL
ncbi:hypothetical protein [Streptomyces asiaticus]